MAVPLAAMVNTVGVPTQPAQVTPFAVTVALPMPAVLAATVPTIVVGQSSPPLATLFCTVVRTIIDDVNHQCRRGGAGPRHHRWRCGSARSQ